MIDNHYLQQTRGNRINQTRGKAWTMNTMIPEADPNTNKAYLQGRVLMIFNEFSWSIE